MPGIQRDIPDTDEARLVIRTRRWLTSGSRLAQRNSPRRPLSIGNRQPDNRNMLLTWPPTSTPRRARLRGA
ncbi:hypothetical protein BZL29_1639 [Mycobacterium kansasii]|uniref:Uncharacterized protein n=1 Tax=Mycobacterium kansasii TaxID=1768 RepID=A0A1V3Y0W1_MYCKA|nr:hypothetical protein BZL29_1639 [Mycobacterium kansasii]